MKIDVGFERRSNPKRYDRIWRRLYNKQTANIKHKLADYRYMDKRDGHKVCDYTYDELLYILSTNTCMYCGSVERLTLDRIDNNGGHTKDNTVVACNWCNMMRGNKYSAEEMEAVGPLIERISELKKEVDRTIQGMRQDR